MKTTTLIFLLHNNQILLALKKQGMGTGKMNGVGGKVETGESIREGAVREAHEEIGIKVRPEDLEYVARITFEFDVKTDWNQVCHVFFVRKWDGEPIESDEMKPEWVKRAALPFERMWSDDPYWLPRALAGEKIVAHFHFTEEGAMTDNFDVTTVQTLV